VSSQVSSRVGDEVAILALDPGQYYGLNATGARIWELLREPIRVATIGETLRREYAVDEATARRDVLSILEKLRGAGLIEVR
jgi:hypothetical protein